MSLRKQIYRLWIQLGNSQSGRAGVVFDGKEVKLIKQDMILEC